MTSRPQDDERLADWVDDRLVGKDRDRFEAELRVSPELRRAAEEYRELTERVRAVLAADVERAPDGLRERVLRELDAPSPLRLWRFHPLVGSLAAAAAIAVIYFAIRALPERSLPPVETAKAKSELDAASDTSATADDDERARGLAKDVGQERDAGARFRHQPGVAQAPEPPPGDPGAPSPAPQAQAPAAEQQAETRDRVEVGAKAEAPATDARDRSALLALAAPATPDSVLVVVVEVPAADARARRLGAPAGRGSPEAPAAAAREGGTLAPRPALQEAQDFARQPLGGEWGDDLAKPELRALGRQGDAGNEATRKAAGSRAEEWKADEPQGAAAKAAEPTPRSAPDPVAFVPQADDELFEVRGDLAQIGRYCRLLTEYAASVAGRLSVQRAAPETFTGVGSLPAGGFYARDRERNDRVDSARVVVVFRRR
jgi:hypothetical protein